MVGNRSWVDDWLLETVEALAPKVALVVELWDPSDFGVLRRLSLIHI